MVDSAGSVTNRLQDASNQASKAAADVAANVKATADDVSNKAQAWVADAAKRAENMSSYLGDQADRATTAMGSRLKVAGETVGDASAAFAQTLESTGNYLQQEGIGGLANDFAVLVKRNPITAVMLGVGFGFMLARNLTHRA